MVELIASIVVDLSDQKLYVYNPPPTCGGLSPWWN